eukprot:1053819-Amphidinium_carterae.1
MNIVSFQQQLKVERKHQTEVLLPSQSIARGRWPLPKLIGARAETHPSVQILETTLPCELVSRSDVCGWRWEMNRKDCMEATLEHL